MPKRVPPLSAKALAAVLPGATPIELVDGYLPGLRSGCSQVAPNRGRLTFETARVSVAALK